MLPGDGRELCRSRATTADREPTVPRLRPPPKADVDAQNQQKGRGGAKIRIESPSRDMHPLHKVNSPRKADEKT